MPQEPILSDAERRFLAETRRAILATLGSEGRPRLVPVCFVLGERDDRMGRPMMYTPIDDKTKSASDPRSLARVRDLLVLPAVTMLVDRWDEDWAKLAWLRVYGSGELLEPQPHERDEHATAIAALRAKYPQYATHRLEDRPIIRVTVDRAVRWGAIDGDAQPEPTARATSATTPTGGGRPPAPADGGSGSSSSPGRSPRR